MGSILSGRAVRIGATAGLALMLVGCATFSDDGGIGGVESTVRKHIEAGHGLVPKRSRQRLVERALPNC